VVVDSGLRQCFLVILNRFLHVRLLGHDLSLSLLVVIGDLHVDGRSFRRCSGLLNELIEQGGTASKRLHGPRDPVLGQAICTRPPDRVGVTVSRPIDFGRGNALRLSPVEA
jgi:hypothetical protein